MFRLLYNNINEILLKKNIKSEVNFFKSLFRISPHSSCLHLFRHILPKSMETKVSIVNHTKYCLRFWLHLAKNLTAHDACSENLNRL